MSTPDHSPIIDNQQWERFSELLWFNEDLCMWVDTSKMNISESDINKYQTKFANAFVAMEKLEAGALANLDENRQVGHYWLRTPTIAPTQKITQEIENQIELINNFSNSILSGEITNSDGNKFLNVLWIGIGGSGLGPLLIVESLQQKHKGINFHFIDNVDSDGIQVKLQNIKNELNQTLFVVVSKSGGTPEPQIGMEQVRYFLERNNINWSDNAIAVTMKNSKLYNQAFEEKWLNIFDLPDWVGGRTSITSSVGLLPISLLGLDSKKFLKGASRMDELTRISRIKSNPSALLALSWLVAGQAKGLKDMVVLPYNDRLQVFSKYLQQLVMESLGKELDRDGKKVNQGIAVYGNKGSTDQHAYVQQLRDGIDNFFITFIEVLRCDNDTHTVNARNPNDYLSGFLQGTRRALTNSKRENLTITIRNLDEYTLGALIAMFERAVSLYAEIININAYHQPGVEAGKKAANDILKLQSEIESLLINNKSISIDDIQKSIPSSDKETIYIILRYLCESSNKYINLANWSNPRDTKIQKSQFKS